MKTAPKEEYESLKDKDDEALALRRFLLKSLLGNLPEYFIETFSHYYTLRELVDKVVVIDRIASRHPAIKIEQAISAIPYNYVEVEQALKGFAWHSKASFAGIDRFLQKSKDAEIESQSPTEILLKTLGLEQTEETSKLDFRSIFFALAPAQPSLRHTKIADPITRIFDKAFPLPLPKEEILAIMDNPTVAAAQMLSAVFRDYVRSNSMLRTHIDQIKRSEGDYWIGLAQKNAQMVPQEKSAPAFNNNVIANALDYLRQAG